jgi:hypothetical protein
MAVLDPSRTTVELSSDELEAAAALLTGEISDAVALEALEAAGVVRNGAIVPYVGRFLMVVAEPKLRIVVERYIAERVVVDDVWAIERLAVWGSEVRGGGTELRPVEPPLLPWEIMRAVGLGPRARPAIDTTLRIPATALAEVERLLAADDREAALALLADATELGATEREVLVDVLLGRRSSWRASSIWTDVGGQRSESVSVIDGGDGGLWISTAEGDAEHTVVCLRPVLPSTVWHHLVRLVPGAPEALEAPAELAALDG